MKTAFACLVVLPGLAAAIDVDLTSTDSIKTAARQIAYDTMVYYKGNTTGWVPGILPGPPPDGDYYWWEAGALWGTMVDYWHFTADTTYNSEVSQAILFQTGPPANAFMPANWSASMGNDDQGFWGLTAMLAAEVAFPNPPADQPQWLALAQAVFNTQAAPDRHDDECGGGIHWQIYSVNGGYNYKNTIANGIFFNMGARLARYTLNATFADWADTQWAWMQGAGLIGDNWDVYDGVRTTDCATVDRAQYSYNAAVLAQGAAFMYDYTGQNETWKARVQGLTNRTLDFFFPDGIMVERACEFDDHTSCTQDQLSFKGYTHRWLATVAQLCPFVADQIWATLKTSTAAAMKVCTGGDDGTQCGFRWSTGSFDGSTGCGQQMSALGALSSWLVSFADDGVTAPVSNTTGGNSTGDPNAGSGATNQDRQTPRAITTGDRVGAGILTTVVLAGVLGGIWTLMSDVGEV